MTWQNKRSSVFVECRVLLLSKHFADNRICFLIYIMDLFSISTARHWFLQLSHCIFVSKCRIVLKLQENGRALLTFKACFQELPALSFSRRLPKVSKRGHCFLMSVGPYVCLSVYPHGITWLPLDRCSWNLIIEDFWEKFCRGNSSFITIWQT
jgi:hypothetical protein